MKPEPIFLFFIMYGIHTLSSSMKLEIYVDLHAFSLEFQAELGFKSKKQKKKKEKKKFQISFNPSLKIRLFYF